MIRSLDKKILFKSLSFVGLVFFCFSCLIDIDYTSAYFSDSTKTFGKTLATGHLRADIEDDDGWKNDNGIVIKPGDSRDREIGVSNSGSLDFQYIFGLEIKSGSDEDFCQSLDLLVELNDQEEYSGPLDGFDLGRTANLGVEDSDDWIFTLSSTSGESDFLESECSLEIIFDSWQIDLDPDEGFSFSKGLGKDTITSRAKECDDDPEEGSGVVINEVMWMGSGASDHDKWIELRNLTDQDLDLGEWYLKGAGSGNSPIRLKEDQKIPAKGFLLIAARKDDHPSQSALNVSVDVHKANMDFDLDYSENGQILLKDKEGKVVDKTPSPDNPDWSAGVSEEDKRWSMQRILDSGKGDDPSSWQTCHRDLLKEEDLETMLSYWKEDFQDTVCGTPGHPNLFEETSGSKIVNTEFFESGKNGDKERDDHDQDKDREDDDKDKEDEYKRSDDKDKEDKDDEEDEEKESSEGGDTEKEEMEDDDDQDGGPDEDEEVIKEEESDEESKEDKEDEE